MSKREILTANDRMVADQCIDRAAAEHGVTTGQLLSLRRAMRLVRARDYAVWLMREYTSLSYPQIAAAFGRTSHSWAHDSYRRFEQRNHPANGGVG